MSDDFEETDFEEEDFQESPEVNTLTRYEEIVFCPDCDVYMPYRVEGAIVRRRCPKCGKEFEGGQEVASGGATGGTKGSASAGGERAARPAAKGSAGTDASPADQEGDAATCAALTRAGTPCQNPPRSGSKYCASHKGYRPRRD